jgi:restriction system protein
MARRRQSLLEDLFDLSAMLPPWLGLALAVASYAGLHYLSIQDVPSPSSGIENAGNHLVSNLIKMLSGVFQYVLPFVFASAQPHPGSSEESGKHSCRRPEHGARQPLYLT